ncbi:MAG: hypothetical protein KatS3mg033_0176 [Thermonema sp.]|nr:MAG: hypothetical protein KatS3mg033_0176 [Thermonema sp.]
MRPQLAEFNQDGIPEVYVGNAIFDALTGKRWVAFDAAKNSGKHEGLSGNNADAYPLAFDIFKNGDPKPGGGTFGPEADGLELIVGNEVYLVDLGNGTNEDSGSLTLAATVFGGASILAISIMMETWSCCCLWLHTFQPGALQYRFA